MFEKRSFWIFLCLFIVLSFSVYAQDDSISQDLIDSSADGSELFTEDEELGKLVSETESFDEELNTAPGLTPNSPFYFVDKIFDNFASDANVRKEKIAEMRVLAGMCGQGDERTCKSLRKSFEEYKKRASNFEMEVSPDESEEAMISSRAIRGVAIGEIAQNVPSGEKDELIREIVQRERGIETAAGIATQVNELCGKLAKLDLDFYYNVCQIDGEDEYVPEWKRKLRQELTEVQREEVKRFGNILTQCFKTSGVECDCGGIAEIGVHMDGFAEACFTIAPLANACENEGDENACEAMSNVEMPELPPHLQEVMGEIERKFGEEQYDRHMPRECVEAGAKTLKDCMRVMIGINAPEECRDALIEANVRDEREAREICEGIMFKLNAPEECVEEGLRDHKECGKYMFQQNAPRECVDAGLTGESRNDHKKCEEIMGKLEGDRRGSNSGPGRGFNFDCKKIENPEKRLKCYDDAVNNVGEHFEDRSGPGGGFPGPCRDAGALDRESCERIMRQDFESKVGETRERERMCAEECGREEQAWNFRDGKCECFGDDRREFNDGGDFRDGEFEGFEEGEFDNSGEVSFSSEDSGSETSESSTEFVTSSNEPSQEPAPITGSFITGNSFLDYYFNF
ncbi:MAG: hypothetical protein Q8P57_03895 [Candidatus Pacearchaeota archaeon]|nr:hypothetical protein [Candidatus Pacearchaeota archaeon]